MKISSPLKKPISLSPALKAVLKVIDQAHGIALLVGGCVRDHLMDLKPKDFDIEVYGLTLDQLEQALVRHFNVIAVGRSFGIFKVIVDQDGKNEVFDVALPRRENKEGRGHKGFVINTDPHMPFEEAAKRRDFTINAMAIDAKNNELLDAHGGLLDLENKVLKHVSSAFAEDPLRVLRAAQFCARFNLSLDPKTSALCESLALELPTLSRERIYEEMKKLLLAPKPSLGFEVLRQTKALILFPELEALIGTPQDPEWHPEGDVWIHTMMVSDEAAQIVRERALNEEEALLVMAGALCHDVGKPPTTKEIDGRIRSLAHDEAGVLLTESLLSRMAFTPRLIPEVQALVREHLKPYQLYRARDTVSDGAIRRLALRVNIERLLMVSRADFLGRTTPEALLGHDPSEPWLRDKVLKLIGHDRAPKPLILGRHLIERGLKPGPEFKEILDRAFNAQLDGVFITLEDGLKWLDKIQRNTRPL